MRLKGENTPVGVGSKMDKETINSPLPHAQGKIQDLAWVSFEPMTSWVAPVGKEIIEIALPAPKVPSPDTSTPDRERKKERERDGKNQAWLFGLLFGIRLVLNEDQLINCLRSWPPAPSAAITYSPRARIKIQNKSPECKAGGAGGVQGGYVEFLSPLLLFPTITDQGRDCSWAGV